MVLRRCRALLKNEEHAVEAMHDTFVEILRRRDLDVAAPSSLLYTAATRVCLNRLRSTRRHPEHGDDLLVSIAGLDDTESQVGAALWLDRIFGREQASTRVIATLHLVDGLTLAETAAQVGLSVSGVRKRLATVTARLGVEEGA